MSRVQRSGLGAFFVKNLHTHFVNESCALNAVVGPEMHRLSSSNEMARNAPKHKSGVQRSALGAFVAKKLRTHFVNESCAFFAIAGPVLHLFFLQ